MRRLISSLLALSLIVVLLPPAAVKSADCNDASKIFSSTYQVEITFDKDGLSKISQKVSLTNLVDGCFASSYSLKINSPDVKDVSGSDSLGKLTTSLKKNKSSSTIVAKLNDEVIGKNKSVTFNLNYKIDGLAIKNGLVWDLIIPAIATAELVDSYNLKILVPGSYGKVFSIQPKAKDVVYGEKQHQIIFDKTAGFGKSIFVSFGDEQQISFKLKVPLENNGLLRKNISVYLPPETQKQQILFTKLDPIPEKIFQDSMGNFVAKYSVKGRDQLQVSIEGNARIVGEGKKYAFSDTPSAENIKNYLSGGKFVQPQERLIQEKAQELKTVTNIYDFVVSFLKYDTEAYEQNQAKRETALFILKNAPASTNQGFVDLFTSLTKAAGIATRQVYGFALSTGNSFKPAFVASPLKTSQMHVWAQVYDKKNKIWVNYDPTWGNTVGVDYISADMTDRIGYFFSNSGDDLHLLKDLSITSENIKIASVGKQVVFKPQVEINIISDQAFAGFPAELLVTIKNKSGLTLFGSKLSVVAKGIDLIDKSSKKIPLIFPYETKKMTFKLRSGDIFNSKKGEIRAEFVSMSGDIPIDEAEKKKIEVQALFSFGTQQILLFIVFLLIITGFLVPKIINTVRKPPQA